MKALKAFLLTLIFVTVFGINSVYAAIEIEPVDTAGTGNWADSCLGTGYCYNSMGLRFTLYKYVNSTTAKKVGQSHDFWRYDTACGNPSSSCSNTQERKPWDYGYDSKGKQTKPQRFSDPRSSNVISDKKNGKRPDSTRFSLTSSTYKGLTNYYTLLNELVKLKNGNTNQLRWANNRDPIIYNSNFLEWIGNGYDKSKRKEYLKNNSIIKTFNGYEKIKNKYQLTAKELNDIQANPKKYFFTAEILGSISTNNASSRPNGFEENRNYVGTVFELNQFYNYTGVFARYAEAMYINGTVYVNGNLVVGGSDSNILRPAEKINQANIWSNRAIGMTIFKLTDIIQSCNSACSGTIKGTNARLKCAENYCENDPESTDSSKKRGCIKSCGYPFNDTFGCDDKACTNDNNGSCQTTNTVKSYTCITPSEYYKRECTEKLTLNYSSGLPKVFINSLGGFNYFVDTNGIKTCTITFNTKKYEFEYAALKRNNRGKGNSVPEKALKNFQTLTTSTTDENYKCKWDDSDTIKMTVNGNDTKSLHKKIDNTSDTTRKSVNSGTIHNYGDVRENLNKNLKATFESTNTSSWELPQMCYHLKDNTQEVVWNSSTDDLTCNNDGKAETFYYGYYIKKVTDADGKLKTKVPVEVKVTKESLKNDNCIKENKCYYLNETKDETAECNISFEKIEDKKYKVKYNVTNRSNLEDISCKFNGRTLTNCNSEHSDIITLNSNETKKVDGSVTYTTASGNNVTVSCPVIIRNKETPVGSKTCKVLYKPANYAGIKKYCRENWDKDTAGYGSYDSCVSDCSNQNGKELCENKFKPNQTTQIKDWCHINYENSGYKSEDSCINTCTTTKIGEGYTYRPIALGESDNPTFKFNAFPKRNAGTNWKGYEQKYTVDDNDYNEQPIYVINLSADNIKRIKQDTKDSGKNVYADFIGKYETNGSFFRSDYVDNNTSIFTRVNEDYWKGAD